MRFLITLVLMMSWGICGAQIVSNWICWGYEDTMISNHVEYWQNGQIRAQNIVANDTLQRVQYYESGAMMFKGHIKAHRGIDTVSIFDPDTYEGYKRYIPYNCNIPAGHFKVFSEAGFLESEGCMSGKNRTGIWYFYYPDGTVMKEIFFSEDGHMDGIFKHYYPSGTIQISGTYVFKEDAVNTFEEYMPQSSELILNQESAFQTSAKWYLELLL